MIVGANEPPNPPRRKPGDAAPPAAPGRESGLHRTPRSPI